MIIAKTAKSADKNRTIAVVDDEPNMTRILARILENTGYKVRPYTDSEVALREILVDPPDMVLSDIKMPRLSGAELLGKITERYPGIPVIMLTAHGTIESAVQAMRAGASDYIQKPFQHDDLLIRIDKGMRDLALLEENQALAERFAAGPADTELIGESPSMLKVREMIAKIAPTNSPVLITGESGTGKELVARAICLASPRAEARFVPINCASIPAQLIESELFGHEKGAFTGASGRKIGLMELASGGTLFLDEIGELPVELQPKLLRALQEREIQRVGGLEPIPVDIRLIAATNRSLEKQIEKGAFREDLYYRLNVLTIQLEPLRKRSRDVVLLAEHFAQRIGERVRQSGVAIAPEAMQTLRAYTWPGNIRELHNIIERMIVLLEGNVIRLEQIPAEIRNAAAIVDNLTPVPGDEEYIRISQRQPYRDAVEEFDRKYLERVLDQCNGVVSKAAEKAGISRRNFYERMEKLGINVRDFKD
ncbi:sigma-54-dependent Fis family transcriptional regulator [Candidatus Sumerlaeota bacterium]|nr:sigma-54-dependent Fis family transcriptional regulator [Candidatus Sumerlaeota bacterium]